MANGSNQSSDSMSATTCRTVIVGGGLAGFAVAIALSGIGHEVTVLERMPVISEVRYQAYCLRALILTTIP